MNYEHKLLIAQPVIQDPIFSGKVIFVIKHEPGGAMGIILNSPVVGQVGFGDIPQASKKNMKKLVKAMQTGEIPSVPVFLGGPCQTPGMYFIHGYKEFTKEPEEPPEFDLGIPTSFSDEDEEVDPRIVIMDGLYFGSPVTFMQIIQSGKLQEGWELFTKNLEKSG